MYIFYFVPRMLNYMYMHIYVYVYYQDNSAKTGEKPMQMAMREQ